MKNIIKLLKYDNTIYGENIISITISLFFIITICFFSIGDFKLNVFIVPLISVILIVNAIKHIVNFVRQMSKEDGRFLFLAPIKGKDFFASKYINFIFYQVAYTIIILLLRYIAGASESEMSLNTIVALSIVIGMFVLFIAITTIVTIISSIFDKVWINVTLSIVFVNIAISLISVISIGIAKLLPYVYIMINNTKYDLIYILLSMVQYIILIAISIKFFDKKLEIK
ncbi:MAG: hypothetical protein GX275_13820 [Clostridiales bacterium]|nr:hypothetical protein [Clostridiales bacterium]